MLTFFTRDIETGKKFVEVWYGDLESSLGVTLQKISFNDLWDANPPREAEGAGLQQYMKDVTCAYSCRQ